VSGGVHGADRPGGNNLADCQVFGYRAGRAAAALASGRPWKFKGTLNQGNPIIQQETRKLESIRDGIDRALMVVRQKETLLELLEKIQAYREEVSALGPVTDNFLLTAEMISRSGLLREESRGIHYREDFPNSDPAFAKASLIRKVKGGEMEAFLG